MKGLDSFVRLVGSWKGTSRLWVSPSEAPRESATHASVALTARGRFVRIDYAWAFDGEPQEGSLLIGCEGDESRVTVAWVDSWHMGQKIMISSGTAKGDGAIDVRGSYSAPPGPDWGWRTVLERGKDDRFRMVMYNVTPDGQEFLAVEATYSRSG